MVRFRQMILNRGKGPGKLQILKPATVESMMTNQIGELTAGKMKNFNRGLSAGVDIQPGRIKKWGSNFWSTPLAAVRPAASPGRDSSTRSNGSIQNAAMRGAHDSRFILHLFVD
jgi:hypothetical protein